MTMNKPAVWGYLRETNELAKKAGVDPDTGVPRTGLPQYLAAIFPNVDDWVHDAECGFLRKDGKKARTRPDFISGKLKLIIEFDGLPHYTSPRQILTDATNTRFYESHGYRVVRIPYFIQLTRLTAAKLFDVAVEADLFDGTVPSVGPKGGNTPAFLCSLGVARMAFEFAQHPEQYEVNVRALWAVSRDQQLLAGAELLEAEYQRIKERRPDLAGRFFDQWPESSS